MTKKIKDFWKNLSFKIELQLIFTRGGFVLEFFGVPNSGDLGFFPQKIPTRKSRKIVLDRDFLFEQNSEIKKYPVYIFLYIF